MSGKKRHKKRKQDEVARENFNDAIFQLKQHPVFEPFLSYLTFVREENSSVCPPSGWAVVKSSGTIHVHPTRRASAGEWSYVLAHCILHLVFGHFRPKHDQKIWQETCDAYIAKFLADLKFAQPPYELSGRVDYPCQSEEKMYEQFIWEGVPQQLQNFGVAGPNCADMIGRDEPAYDENGKPVNWQVLFARGLAAAATSAVNVAAGVESYLGDNDSRENYQGEAAKARRWFINHYPLLGSMAAAFEIIENPRTCLSESVSIAAVNAEANKIYVNPAAGLSEEEYKFVLAHEFLHVGLRHHARCQGRDHYLWNIACDFVINAWLVEMDVGVMPSGILFDPELKGMSAEAVYDLIVRDLRRSRRLRTLRGCCGLGDIIPGAPQWWCRGRGVDLDEFYRRALAEGLQYHGEGRGYLPAGLIEEIRALSQPPIPWDVELARWFDLYFPPLEKKRSYARPSRRQMSTPDIPRPSWSPAEIDPYRTFGVVLDTSGSMDHKILGNALGAIASYGASREVPFVRVVFCDAQAYDQGFMACDDIAGRVKVRGRGGTVLQPGINLLQSAADFPAAGPILVITDAQCDQVVIKNEHAFLVPQGASLPFRPHGPVFRIS